MKEKSANIVSVLFEERLLQRKLPANFIEEDINLFAHELKRKNPASYLYAFKYVFLTSDGIIIKGFSPLKNFITGYLSDFKFYKNKYILKIFLTKKCRILSAKNGPYILGFDNYCKGPGSAHWLSDGLTKLLELEQLLKTHTLILPEEYLDDAYKMDSLKIFGQINLLFIKSNEYFLIPNLKVASPLAPSGNHVPENVNRLRAKFWKKYNKDLVFSLGEKIYISREKATRRKILNEGDVQFSLRSLGFTVVYMEDFTLAQQISIIYNSSIIVGPHGAGLANIHFMKPGSKIVEIRAKSDNRNNMYFSLASDLGLIYYYLKCESEQISSIGNNFNLKVSINELEHLVKNL